MIRNCSPIFQALILIIFSFFIGLTFNHIRSDSKGISLKAKNLESAKSEDLFSHNESFGSIKSISSEQAISLYNSGILFIDARDKEDYDAGHIPKALSSFDFIDLLFNIEEIQDKSKPIVTYCDGGECAKSEELAFSLQESGYQKIYVYLGGWSDWIELNMEVEKWVIY